MGKWCPICLETVDEIDTIWPYPCGHSVCKSCHHKSFLSGNYTCPECRALPLCPYALFIHHHTRSGHQLPPVSVQSLYDAANGDEHPPPPPQTTQFVVPMPPNNLHPPSNPTLAVMAERALELINTQFIAYPQSSSPPPPSSQPPPPPSSQPSPFATQQTVENPSTTMISAMANELINAQLGVNRTDR